MRFDLTPVPGPGARMAPVSAPKKSTAPQSTQSAAGSDAVTVDVSSSTIPDRPPAEVLDAMGVASHAYDRLAASGRGLTFRVDDATGKVQVQVHDSSGNVMFAVPASKALDIASGGSLDK
jgi:uncharacterized FlaG/YvyC family protein